MMRQVTDWGEIFWLEDKKTEESVQGLQTGIVTLNKGAHQARHIHYEEQVIYVLQGKARSLINGEETILTEGGFFHWQAGVVHEVFNMGAVPFKHLLVSGLAQSETEPLFPERDSEEVCRTEEKVSPDLIYIAVEAIRTQFLESMHYGYAIFDAYGNLILQSQYMPEYCEECCRASASAGQCACMLRLRPGEWEQEQTFRCENGMEIFHYPIFYRNIFLGYIQSGYIRHESHADGKLKEVYDVPESVVWGIKALMRRILKAIRNYCEFEQFRKNLMEKELELASREETSRVLMKNLQDTQYEVTDLKINHHFLFNTLNSMASMALDSGSMDLYQSIVDLSKMFRYTLRTQNSVVPLAREVEYISAYLQLQKLRYGDALEIIKEIQPEALKAQVPFNFLQPVAENAFSHGFEENAVKKLRIHICVEDKPAEIPEQDGRDKEKYTMTGIRAGERWVRIQVINNGKKLTEENVRIINQTIHSTTSHGLSMVYRKMTAVFGQECKFEISSGHGGNTCFVIGFPFHS